MAFLIEIDQGEKVDRTLTLTSGGGAYDLTGKRVTLAIGATVESDEPLLTKSTAVAAEASHDDEGGIVTVHFLAADADSIPHIVGKRVNGVAATNYPATIRVDDGDVANAVVVETGVVRVSAVVPFA